MGGICTSEKKVKKREKIKKGEMKLEEPNPNSSLVIQGPTVDSRIKILQRGIESELSEMINTYVETEDINAYTFGGNKTLLLQAVSDCRNCIVIDLIMEKNADINLKEKNCGNNALFLSAVNLKTDFVKRLIHYKIDVNATNLKNQNILSYLEEQLITNKNKYKRVLTTQENEKYQNIVSIIKQAQAG